MYVNSRHELSGGVWLALLLGSLIWLVGFILVTSAIGTTAGTSGHATAVPTYGPESRVEFETERGWELTMEDEMDSLYNGALVTAAMFGQVLFFLLAALGGIDLAMWMDDRRGWRDGRGDERPLPGLVQAIRSVAVFGSAMACGGIYWLIPVLIRPAI